MRCVLNIESESCRSDGDNITRLMELRRFVKLLKLFRHTSCFFTTSGRLVKNRKFYWVGYEYGLYFIKELMRDKNFYIYERGAIRLQMFVAGSLLKSRICIADL